MGRDYEDIIIAGWQTGAAAATGGLWIGAVRWRRRRWSIHFRPRSGSDLSTASQSRIDVIWAGAVVCLEAILGEKGVCVY